MQQFKFPPELGISISVDDLKWNDNNFCKRCGCPLNRWSINKYCSNCEWIVEEEQKEQVTFLYFWLLSQLSLEERIELIEEWIFEHSFNHPKAEVRFR